MQDVSRAALELSLVKRIQGTKEKLELLRKDEQVVLDKIRMIENEFNKLSSEIKSAEEKKEEALMALVKFVKEIYMSDAEFRTIYDINVEMRTLELKGKEPLEDSLVGMHKNYGIAIDGFLGYNFNRQYDNVASPIGIIQESPKVVTHLNSINVNPFTKRMEAFNKKYPLYMKHHDEFYNIKSALHNLKESLEKRKAEAELKVNKILREKALKYDTKIYVLEHDIEATSLQLSTIRSLSPSSPPVAGSIPAGIAAAPPGGVMVYSPKAVAVAVAVAPSASLSAENPERPEGVREDEFQSGKIAIR